jgi:hypothetical protein
MTLPAVKPQGSGVTALIWLAGGAALVGMAIFSHVTERPYPTTWPWISFVGMAILEEVLIAPAGGGSSPGPRIVLIAAIIMFRKHPDVIALVTAGAGLAGGGLLRLPWRAILTRTALLLILAAVGTASLRVVGYADTPHFVAATAVLILLYVACTAVPSGPRAEPVRWLGAGVLAALLALAWRTPASGPVMLRLGEVAVLAVAGIAAGFALGGSPRGLLRRRRPLGGLPVLIIVGGAGLLVSTRLPSQTAAILAAVSLTLIAVVALRRRWFPVACMLLGGLCNEIARVVNGGLMPVETAGLPAGLADELGNLGQTSMTYKAVDAHTHLAWLADRFPLGPFPGLASVGDILIGLGIIWIFAALTAAPPATSLETATTARAA